MSCIFQPPRLRQFAGFASVLTLLGSSLLAAPGAMASPYRCDSVDPTSQSLVAAQDLLPEDDQLHPDCGGAGMAGFTLSRGGSTFLRMELFPGNNTYRAGTGKARGWSLRKDTAGHANKAWKLKDRSGSIRASIYADGKFACDRYSQCAV